MKYDLHIHTNHSLCSSLSPETILKISKKLKLDGIAVVDHNSMKGALKVKKLNKDKDFEVIVGTEVKTDLGELLAYYVNSDINSIGVFEAIDEIKSQGGLVVVAHPFRLLPHFRLKQPLKEFVGKIDGVECLNKRTGFFANKYASEACDSLKIAKTAGSDAHFSFEIGKARTVFDGDLRKALKTRKTKLEGDFTFGFIASPLSFLLKNKRKLFNRNYKSVGE